MLNIAINSIQSRLILHICVSHPNSITLCMIGPTKDNANPEYIIAR